MSTTTRLPALLPALTIALLASACEHPPTDLTAMAGSYKQGDKTLTVEKDKLSITTSTGSEKIQFLTVKCEPATKCVGSTAIFGDATLERKDKTLSITGSGLAKNFGGDWTAQ